MGQDRTRLMTLMEVAVLAAFAMALQMIPHKTGISGVELNYGLIPIVVLALRRGIGPAMFAGFVWGLMDLVLVGLPEGSVLNPLQGFLEYFFAFALVGLAGMTRRSFQRAVRDNTHGKALGFAWAGVAIGAFGKYLVHFVAGWVYWGAYAPAGQPAWLYSLWVNGGSYLFSTALAMVVIGALVTMLAPQLFLPKGQRKLKAG